MSSALKNGVIVTGTKHYMESMEEASDCHQSYKGYFSQVHLDFPDSTSNKLRKLLCINSALKMLQVKSSLISDYGTNCFVLQCVYNSHCIGLVWCHLLAGTIQC